MNWVKNIGHQLTAQFDGLSTYLNDRGIAFTPHFFIVSSSWLSQICMLVHPIATQFVDGELLYLMCF